MSDTRIVIGSEDLYVVRYVDSYIDAVTGRLVETPINLTLWTELRLQIAVETAPGVFGSFVSKNLVKQNQSLKPGYAEYRWKTTDLQAGKMKVRATGKDEQGFTHWSESIFETVEAP